MLSPVEHAYLNLRVSNALFTAKMPWYSLEVIVGVSYPAYMSSSFDYDHTARAARRKLEIDTRCDGYRAVWRPL